MIFIQVILRNYIPLIMLLILLGFVIKNPFFDKKQRRIFIWSVIINMFMIVIMGLDYIFARTTILICDVDLTWILRRITTFINFASSPLIPILLMKIYSQRKKGVLYFIPVILNFIICIFSIDNGIVFSITPRNEYERGPLFLVPILVTTLYLLFLIIEPLDSQWRSKKKERQYLLFVIFLIYTSFSAEIIFLYYFLVWGSTAVGLSGYYFYLTMNQFIVDSLTGAYNRAMYSNRLSQIDKKQSVLITILDINYLKKTNDEQGHKAGDDLLINFSNIIIAHTNKCSDFFRIGGDEFILLTYPQNISVYYQAMKNVDLIAKAQNISFARGEAMYDPSKNLEAILQSADEMMYQHKKEIKRLDAMAQH